MLIPVQVYCNLTYVDALHLGLKHNKERKNAKKESFLDQTKRYQSQYDVGHEEAIFSSNISDFSIALNKLDELCKSVHRVQ